MPVSHILLQRARTYSQKERDLRPPDCNYDPIAGAWFNSSSDRFWIDTPDRVGPRTKKEDIETGEDQKRE